VSEIMEKGEPSQGSRKLRSPRAVAMDMCRFGNMAAASGDAGVCEKLDLLAIEWLVVRGLEVEIRQDHSGQSVSVAQTA